MKLRIEKLFRKEINTARGPATQVIVESGGQRYSAWSGDWNNGWRVGDEVEVTVNQVAKGDKVYNNIQAPTSGRQAPQPTVPAIDFRPFIEAIQQDQRKILSHLYTIEALVRSLTKEDDLPPPPEDAPPHTDEDAPGEPLPF